MNSRELTRFYSESREKHGYEVAESSFRAGMFRIIGPHPAEGEVRFFDSYWANGGQFGGFAGVIEKGDIAWVANYRGKILDEDGDKDKTDQFYDNILKPALRQFPRDRPFKRGPDILKIGDYEYFNECKGNMEFFSNIEFVTHIPTGRRKYEYSDEGGIFMAVLNRTSLIPR